MGSEKPDRSWEVGEFRGKVHSDVIKFIHPRVKSPKQNRPFRVQNRLVVVGLHNPVEMDTITCGLNRPQTETVSAF